MFKCPVFSNFCCYCPLKVIIIILQACIFNIVVTIFVNISLIIILIHHMKVGAIIIGIIYLILGLILIVIVILIFINLILIQPMKVGAIVIGVIYIILGLILIVILIFIFINFILIHFMKVGAIIIGVIYLILGLTGGLFFTIFGSGWLDPFDFDFHMWDMGMVKISDGQVQNSSFKT